VTRPLDISKLSDQELFQLNREIVALVHARSRQRDRKKLLSFDLGDRVIFDGPQGGKVHGTIVRLNQKSLTIITDQGTWRIDPSFVSKEREKKLPKTKGGNVLQLRPGGSLASL